MLKTHVVIDNDAYEIIKEMLNAQECAKDGSIVAEKLLINGSPIKLDGSEESIRNSCAILEATIKAVRTIKEEYSESYLKASLSRKNPTSRLKAKRLVKDIHWLINHTDFETISVQNQRLYGCFVYWVLLSRYQYLAIAKENGYRYLVDYYVDYVVPKLFPSADAALSMEIANIIHQIDVNVNDIVDGMRKNVPVAIYQYQYMRAFFPIHYLTSKHIK